MPSTVTIKPGDRGVDYAYLTPRVRLYILASLKTDKPVKFAARYIAATGKGLDVDERLWLHSIGIGIKGIKENTVDDSDKGYAHGVKVAQEAVDRLAVDPAWTGYPKGLSVTMCADKDIKADGTGPAAAFFRGGKSVLDRAGYETAGYGDEDIIGAVPEVKLWCLPGAWFWSPHWWRAFKAGLPWTITPTMLQKLDKANQVDVLTVYGGPFEVWLPTPDPVPEVVTPPRTLRYGMRGADVKALQARLGLKEWGYFGPLTLRAVKKFQATKGLKVDGIVGPITRKALGL